MKEKVNDALKQHFRPEFLNRIDDTIVFHELSRDEVIQIVDLIIKRPTVQLQSGHRHRASPTRRQGCWWNGADPTIGARPLRRAIQRLVEDPVSGAAAWKEFRPVRSSWWTPRCRPRVGQRRDGHVTFTPREASEPPSFRRWPRRLRAPPRCGVAHPEHN